MKKIKLIILLVMLCMAFCLISCTDSEKKLSTENIVKSKVGLDLSAMEYNPETDAQSGFANYNSHVTKSEHGYYFFDTGHMGFMMYYDINLGQKVPLCNRPDCRHDSKDCNAYYMAIMNPADGIHYSTNYVQFYDGSLYVIGYDEEEYVNLYKISEDGSSREYSTALFKADFTPSDGVVSRDSREWSTPEVCIHRGYVYFIDLRETEKKLRRVKIGESEAEVVYENESQSEVYRILPYGDYVFFQAAGVLGEEAEWDGNIYAYDIRSGEIQMVKKGVFTTYTIAGEQLYYCDDSGIWGCSLVTMEEKLLVKDVKSLNFSTDGKYIYTCDEETGTLEVYDNKGNLIERVVDENVGIYFGCDSQYLFALGAMEHKHGTGSAEVPPAGSVKLSDILSADKNFMAVMNLSKLQQGKGKWAYLFNFDYLTD